jgi:hypothetical protein
VQVSSKEQQEMALREQCHPHNKQHQQSVYSNNNQLLVSQAQSVSDARTQRRGTIRALRFHKLIERLPISQHHIIIADSKYGGYAFLPANLQGYTLSCQYNGKVGYVLQYRKRRVQKCFCAGVHSVLPVFSCQ